MCYSGIFLVPKRTLDPPASRVRVQFLGVGRLADCENARQAHTAPSRAQLDDLVSVRSFESVWRHSEQISGFADSNEAFGFDVGRKFGPVNGGSRHWIWFPLVNAG